MASKNPQILPYSEFPALLREIPDPPRQLFVRGTLPDTSFLWLCVVGSRKCSPYGASVCKRFVRELADYPVVIVSGLALGIDSVAHETALECGLPTVAVPGSGIDDDALYPRAHVGLAHTIIERGGALLSESQPNEEASVWSFPKRNRIMAGLCHATLIIEAREKSGTLITARLALEYNRDVLVVPGPVTSPECTGSNRLLREGAQAATSSADILQTLHIEARSRAEESVAELLPEEQSVLAALSEPKTADEISAHTHLPVSRVHIIVSMLEIKQFVAAQLGKITRVR